MCTICNDGVLGRSPDGEIVFCTCALGAQAAVDDSRARLAAYAEQLEHFDAHSELLPTMQLQRDRIAVAFDAEMVWHDHYAAQLKRSDR